MVTREGKTMTGNVMPVAYIYSGNNYHPKCLRGQLVAEYAWGHHRIWNNVDIHVLVEFLAQANGCVFEESDWDSSIIPKPKFRIGGDEYCNMCGKNLLSAPDEIFQEMLLGYNSLDMSAMYSRNEYDEEYG